MHEVPDLSPVEVTSVVVNHLDGSFWFELTEPTDFSIQVATDTKEKTGKGGRVLSSVDRNKNITVSVTNALMNGGLQEAQSGARFTKGATLMRREDYLTVSEGKALTTRKAVGTIGAEIKYVIVLKNGVKMSALEQASAASQGKFAYTPTTKTLTFHTDITDGTEIFVAYDYKADGYSLEDSSDKTSEYAEIYVNCLSEDVCNKNAIYATQYFIPKAKISGNYSLGVTDNDNNHSFEAKATNSGCGTSSKLWSYRIVGQDAQDIAE